VAVDWNRMKAQRFRDNGNVDKGDGDSMFTQMYRVMKSKRDDYWFYFKTKDVNKRVWKANFLHEGSIDDGGPYRESMEELSNEISSGVVSLVRPSEN
jgi:hypothetical protein